MFAEAQAGRSKFVKKMNKVIGRIFLHEQNLVKLRIRHQRNQQEINARYDRNINKLEEWKLRLETGVDDVERKEIQQLIAKITGYPEGSAFSSIPTAIDILEKKGVKTLRMMQLPTLNTTMNKINKFMPNYQ